LQLKNLVIIGAGNVGGFLAYNPELFSQQFNILGFVDDDSSKIGKEFYGYPVIGDINSLLSISRDTAVVIGIASPKAKKKIFEKLAEEGFTFPAFVANNAWLSNKVTVGMGAIIYPGVSINYETKVGDFVIMNMNCAIGHNCEIAAYCALAPGVNLAGFTRVEEAVDLGIGVSTRQNILVGHDAIIGGQTMLVKNVLPGATIVGVPGAQIETK
jgi:sugar O-acyltransferase (sialic acid O-acetyltransferase NeuD family)